MTQAYSPEQVRPQVAAASLAGAHPGLGLVALLLVALCVCVSIYRLRPPAAVGAEAAATEFSSGRALKHVGSIARRPHPLGTDEHEAVRNYIVGEMGALGLAPEVQEAVATTGGGGGRGPFAAATVRNVAARLKGSEGKSALMLVAHYDSVPTGPGASDDGSGVATLIETARALKSGPTLKNDVIFLFTDAEEVGLLGARAFMDEHPWAKDARLVLNFEARGNGGPSLMFETSSGNGRLVSEFAAAAPRPAANSLMYEVYRLLPNDTDLSVFKKAGLPGLNFAFANGLTHYHTQLDSAENLDERSLQHQGSYALALARHFGDRDLSNLRQPNSVYFDLLGLFVARYPALWVLPLALLVTILFVVAVMLGLSRGHIKLKGVIFGFVAMLASMIAAPVVVTLAWWVIRAVHGGYGRIPQGDTYNGYLYLMAFAAMAVAVFAAVMALFRRRATALDMLVGAMFWWVLWMIVTSLLIPGGSYLLTLPLFFMIAGLLLAFLRRGWEADARGLALLTLFALPGVLLLVPAVRILGVALPLSMGGVGALFLVLLLGLLIPALGLAGASKRWLPAGAALGVALALIVCGALTAGFDRTRPEPSDLFYGLNADTGKAVWASSDAAPNAWTAQFLKGRPDFAPLREFFPVSSRPYMTTPAPEMTAGAPQVTLLDDRTEGDTRTLRLRVASTRSAPFVSVQTDAPLEVIDSQVNGRKLGPSDRLPTPEGPQHRWALRYYGLPADGVELTLQTKAGQPLKLRVTDETYGLPSALAASFKPMPEEMMPTPFAFSPYANSTLVSKSFTF